MNSHVIEITGIYDDWCQVTTCLIETNIRLVRTKRNAQNKKYFPNEKVQLIKYKLQEKVNPAVDQQNCISWGNNVPVIQFTI